MQNNLRIKVPICKEAKIGAEVQQVNFELKAVICHLGKASTGGHYYVLKFEDNGDVIQINDREVLSKFNLNRNPEVFKQWLIRENVGGVNYLFARV